MNGVWSMIALEGRSVTWNGECAGMTETDEFLERLAIIEIDGGVSGAIAKELAELCVSDKPNSRTVEQWEELIKKTAISVEKLKRHWKK